MLKPFARSWGAGQAFSFVIPAITLVISGLLGTSITLAQTGHQQGQNIPESAQASRVRALNNSLLQLHGQMQLGTPGSATAIRSEAATVIAERAAALSALIPENPRAALSFAFSPELVADLAAKFPQAASLLESHTTVTGPLQHWIADSADMKTSRSYFLMSVGSQTLTLHFAGAEPNPKPGESLKASGVVVGSDMAVLNAVAIGGSISAPAMPASFPHANPVRGLRWPILVMGILLFTVTFIAAGIRTLRGGLALACKQCAVYAVVFGLIVVCDPAVGYAQSACSTTGAQNTLVILATFPGITPPSNVTSTSMTAFFFGPAPSLTNFWQETSNGQTSASGTVSGWYTLTGAYSCGNLFSVLAPDAIAVAANAGINVNDYTRVFVFSPDLSCGLAALSTVGCASVSTSAGTFNLSMTVLFNNSYFFDNTEYVVQHEAGHQMGLAHAKLRQYTNASGNLIPLGGLSDTGTLLEYGDHFSTMGTENIGHYAAGHGADQLNWLAGGTDYQVVQSSGTYTIQPYEGLGLRALKVQRGTSNNAWLWLEYRQPLGNYDWTYGTQQPYSTQPYSGATIHYEDSTTAPATHLLDFTAPNAYTDDPALVAGQTWTDPYTNLSLSVLSATSSGLTVNVNYGATACAPSAPTVNLSPLDPSIYPGQNASYSVSVTNNDSSACGSSVISLGSTEPSGWTTSLSSSSVTLSPGQSASVTMGKGAPSGTPAGTYAVNLSASDTSSTASDTANATVMTPPTLAVNISVPGTTFVPPATVSIAALVTNGGTPALGASVTFTLQAPNGTTAKQTATTGTNGIATWNYKLNSKSLTGTYSASAQAALGSGSGGKKTSTSPGTQTATSNSVTFAVQ